MLLSPWSISRRVYIALCLMFVVSGVKIICRHFKDMRISNFPSDTACPPPVQQTCRLPSSSRLQCRTCVCCEPKGRWSAESNANKNNNIACKCADPRGEIIRVGWGASKPLAILQKTTFQPDLWFFCTCEYGESLALIIFSTNSDSIVGGLHICDMFLL